MTLASRLTGALGVALLLTACGGKSGDEPPAAAPVAAPKPPDLPSGWQTVKGEGYLAALPDGPLQHPSPHAWKTRRGHVAFDLAEATPSTDVPEKALALAADAYFRDCGGGVLKAYRDDVPGRTTLVVDGTCSGAQAIGQFHLRGQRLVELVAVVSGAGAPDAQDADDIRAFFKGFRFEN